MNEILPSQLRHTTYMLNLLEHEQRLSVNFHSKAIILFSIFLTGNWNVNISKFRNDKSVNFRRSALNVIDVHLPAWLPLANHKPEMVFSRELNYNYQKSLRFYVIMQMVYWKPFGFWCLVWLGRSSLDADWLYFHMLRKLYAKLIRIR